MLLAKLKFAFFGLVALAVVSTSVGVVAQSPADRPADSDRLKAVEQKLDRLLEVLGGRHGRQPSPDAPPMFSPDPRIPAEARSRTCRRFLSRHHRRWPRCLRLRRIRGCALCRCR